MAIFGGKFTTTQATIDTILTSLAVSGIPNNAIASSLGVSRKRVAKAKSRITEFDSLVQTEVEKESKQKNHRQIDEYQTEHEINNDDDSSGKFSTLDDLQSDISHDFKEMSNDGTISATMVYRFKPEVCSHFHTAQSIAEYLGGLPNGQLSSVFVDVNTLKRALANKGLREGLIATLPGYCEFNRSSTKQDVRSVGLHAFPKGYRIKVSTSRSSNDVSVTFRSEIDMLTNSLAQYYNQHNVSSHLNEKPFPINNSISPDYFTPLISSQQQITDESTLSSVGISTADMRDDGVIGVKKKRGRPKLSLQEHAKRFKRLRMPVSYRNAKLLSLSERLLSLSASLAW